VKSYFVLASSLVLSLQVSALTLGPIETAGNACEAAPGRYSAQETFEGSQRYQIPIGIYVKKEEDRGVARGVCTFALNVKADAGKKIVVSNSRQIVSLRAYPEQTKVQAELEIFRVGTHGEKAILTAESSTLTRRVADSLGSEEILAETECAGSATLRGNLSIMALGAGKARAFARDLFIDIKEVSCE
jgi:hypothetical protein